MSRGRWRVPAALALVTAFASVARAEELGWKLAGTTCRYDLEGLERVPPEPSPAPVFVPLLLIGEGDFRDPRTPRRALDDPGDLVWHYAMLLPAGDVTERGVEARFEERLAISPTQALICRGVHQSRLRGRKATIRTTVDFTGDPLGHWCRDGKLVMERTFAARDGRLEGATFTLEINVLTGTPPAPVKGAWRGRIVPKDELRVGERGFPQQVQESVGKGVGWLTRASGERLAAFRSGGGIQALGEIALPVFALLRSGVPLSEVERFFEWMHTQPFKAVYSVSLYIMALEARSIQRTAVPPAGGTRSIARFDRNAPRQDDVLRMRQALSWLLACRKQGEGWWSYGGRPTEAAERWDDLPSPAEGTQRRTPPPPPRGGAAGGLTGVPLGHDLTSVAAGGDRSNTQFAILALHSGASCEIPIPGEVWEEILTELVESQQADGPRYDGEPSVYGASSPLSFDPRDVPMGETSERPRGALTPEERLSALARGWDYPTKQRGNAYGSMSGAGLSSVAIAREGLIATRRLTPERDRQALLAMRDGLAWFAVNFDPARNVNRGAAWYYYYLYSVEKAMDLCGVERVGPHEWWREGAAELLARQLPNGSWANDVNETSLALLFLNRATLPAKLDIEAARRVATGGPDDPSAWDKVTISGTGVVSMRQLLASLVSAQAAEVRERLPMAQQAMASFDEVERPRLLPELVALLDNPNRGVKAFARDTCVAVAGSADPAAIADFTRRWEELRVAWTTSDVSKVPAAQAILTDAAAVVPLKKAALTALTRLRACEAMGEVIAQLEHRDGGVRALAGQTAVALAGPRCPYEPEAAPAQRKTQADAWRAWWRESGPALVTAERVRRAVADLAIDAKAAKAVQDLKAIGQPAVRGLIDGLRVEAARLRAHAVLQELTGQRFPADVAPWLEWWDSAHPQ